MIRHQTNQNLTLHFDETYLGLRIMFEYAPLIREYLQVLHQTMVRAIEQYPRVFAFRFDLRFPASCDTRSFLNDNAILDRFFASFKAQIRHNRDKALQKNRSAHDTVVRYVWAREVGQRGRLHYHVAVMLNMDAFNSVGMFIPGIENMYNRLNKAWASALGMSLDATTWSVYVPSEPYLYIRRDDKKNFAEFFRRTSYFCKTDTKSFGNGCHSFGASRI